MPIRLCSSVQRSPHELSFRLGLGLGLCVALSLRAGPAWAENGQKAKIAGSIVDNGHRYVWTVTNLHSSPIVAVEFPHYHADLFLIPDGWSDEGTTNLVGRGGGDNPGICRASVKPQAKGIAPQGQAVFDMRIAGAGAHTGTGSVSIQFADGTRAEVSGVALPVPEPSLPRYARLAGYAALFGLFLLWASMRRRGGGQENEPGSVADG
ncbi:MAG: hypothetical protein ACE5GE_01190 [Phycisphaerae bacterium]